MVVGVQQMDRRSQVRATQHRGGSNGSRGSSSSTTNHLLGQQWMCRLVMAALPMRLLPPAGCAVAEADKGAAATNNVLAASRVGETARVLQTPLDGK